MKLQIESPHVETDNLMTDLIQDKFDRLGKMFDRIQHCEVVLKKEKNEKQKNFSVQARMEVPKLSLYASETDLNFESALDKVVDDLEHQLRKYKEELEERGKTIDG